MCMLGLVLLIAGGSRGPLVGFVFSLGIFYLSINFSWRKLRSLLFIVLGVVFFIFVAKYAQDSINSSALDRFLNAFNFGSVASQSIESRVNMMESALQLFFEYPILGVSIIEPGSGWYPHNIFLEILMSTGLVGGVCFITLVVLLVKSAFVILNYQYSMFWLVLLFSQAFVTSMTSGAVWGVSTFWILLACIIMSGGVISRQVGRTRETIRRHRKYVPRSV